MRRRGRRAAALVIWGALLAVAAGCAGAGSESASGSHAAGAVSPTVAVATTVSPANADTANDAGGAGGAAAPGGTTAPGPSSGTTTALPDPGSDGGRLRVTQQQGGCCGPAIALFTLVVRDAAGAEVLHRRYGALADSLPVLDVVLPAGHYRVESSQQPCLARCADLPIPAAQCSTDLDLAPAAEANLLVTYSAPGTCAAVATAAPLATAVADAIALAGADVDCGLDTALAEAAATGDNVAASPARECLRDGIDAGSTAYLQALEPVSGSTQLTAVVYRTLPDGSVDVLQVVDPAAAVRVWERSHCGSVAPDPVRTFLLQRCSDPTAVPWG